MSWQQMDPRGADSEESNSYKSEYRDVSYDSDDTPSYGQKIYPRSKSSSAFQRVIATISWIFWLLALCVVLMILLTTRTSVVSSSVNSDQPPMVTNLHNGPYLLFVVVAFLLFSALLFALNWFVRKKN